MKTFRKLPLITFMSVLLIGCGSGSSETNNDSKTSANNNGTTTPGSSSSSGGAGGNSTPTTSSGGAGGNSTPPPQTTKSLFDKYRITKSTTTYAYNKKTWVYDYSYDNKNHLKVTKISEFNSDGSENVSESFTQTNEYNADDNLIKRTSKSSEAITTGVSTFTYDGDNIATQEQRGNIISFFNYNAGYATLQEAAGHNGEKLSTVTREVNNKKLSKYHYINTDGKYENTETYTYDDAKGVTSNRYSFFLNGRTKKGTERMTYDVTSNLRIPECFIGNYKARNKPFEGTYGLATADMKTPSSYACKLPIKHYNKYDHWDNGQIVTYKYQSDNRGLVTELKTYDSSNELEYTKSYEYETY